MECPKCGNQMEGKLCDSCGYEISLFNEFKSININKQNKFLQSLVFLCVIVFFLVLGFGFRFLKNYEVLDYINFNNNLIPTVYKVIGKKEINKVYKNDFSQILTYNVKDFTDDELYDYIEALYDINYVDTDSNTGLKLIKECEESGKIMIIEINSDSDIINFKYSYIGGNLKDYALSGNIDIGDSLYGFMSIPGNFSKKVDDHGVLEYINSKNRKEKIKLSYLNATVPVLNYTKSLVVELENNGLDCTINNSSIYGNNGYLIESVNNTKHELSKTWIFKDKQDRLYTVEIKSNNYNSSLFETIYSYTLEK